MSFWMRLLLHLLTAHDLSLILHIDFFSPITLFITVFCKLCIVGFQNLTGLCQMFVTGSFVFQ